MNITTLYFECDNFECPDYCTVGTSVDIEHESEITIYTKPYCTTCKKQLTLTSQETRDLTRNYPQARITKDKWYITLIKRLQKIILW